MTTEVITLEQTGAYEMGACQQVGDALERHYPGWMWMVASPPKSGMVFVKSGFMDPAYGFKLNLPRSYSASDLAHEAVLAGGELLERVGMPRSKYDFDRERAAQNKSPMDFLTFQK